MTLLLITTMQFSFFYHLSGQIISGELKQWHKVTITFSGPECTETGTPNPFTDYRLNVSFKGPNGQEYLVPGYYAADGNAAETSAGKGNKWRSHFSPDEAGEWTYQVSFRHGPSINMSQDQSAGSPCHFDGLTGSLQIKPTDKKGDDLRAKGRLSYVGEHYLRFTGNGEYFLKQGTDSPENFLAYADFDGSFDEDGINDEKVKSWNPHLKDWNSGDPDWQDGKGRGIIGAINYLAEEGLNAFSFLTMNIEGDDKNVFPYLSYTERLRMDVSRLDQWEIVFEHADKGGMYLHFKTQETENDHLLDEGELGPERILYYRELIARFSHHLALNWNLGEENTNTTEQIKAFAAYFYATDPYQNNIVIHTYPGKKEEVYTPLLGSASNITGLSLQTNAPDFSNVYPDVKTWVEKSAKYGKPWVVACDEPGDAQHAIRPDSDAGESHEDGRRNALWGTIMAGGAGNEYYFGYKHAHSDLTCEDFRSRDQWWDYCRNALLFFDRYQVPFWDLQPLDIVTHNGWCLGNEDDIYLIYLPEVESTELNLSGRGKYLIRWYSPSDGGDLLSGTVKHVRGKGQRNLGEPPFSGEQDDWLVVVIRAGLADKMNIQ